MEENRIRYFPLSIKCSMADDFSYFGRKDFEMRTLETVGVNFRRKKDEQEIVVFINKSILVLGIDAKTSKYMKYTLCH